MCICLHPLFTEGICESQSGCPSLLTVIYHIPTPVTGHWPCLGMESLLHLQRAQIIPRQPEEIVQAQRSGPGPRTPGLGRAVLIFVRSSRVQTLCSCISRTQKSFPKPLRVFPEQHPSSLQDRKVLDGMAPWQPWHMEVWASLHLLLLTHL